MSELKPHDKAVILLVEDNHADVTLVEEALSEAGVVCTLQVVTDGSEAIEMIERLDADASLPGPELILLDLNLPRVSGEDVLRRVRSKGRCQAIPVLVVSSSAAPVDRQRAMSLGATDYFRKPSSLDEFLELGPKVRDLLRS